MDYNEFAEKIKTKYPQYKDMDNRELATRMVEKYPQYNDVTFDTPKQEKRGINLTPSGIANKIGNTIGAGLASPIVAARENIPINEAFNKAVQTGENYRANDKLAGAQDFITDLAGYSALPVLRGGGVGRFLGNAAIQGGTVGALESLKREGDLSGFGSGTGIAAGIQSIPYVGRLARPAVQLLPASGKLIAKSLGRINPETLKRAVQADSKALDLTEKEAQNLLMNTTERVQKNYNDILNKSGENVQQAIKNLGENPQRIDVGALEGDIKSTFDQYGGDLINPARNMTGKTEQDLIDLVNSGNIPLPENITPEQLQQINPELINTISPMDLQKAKEQVGHMVNWADETAKNYKNPILEQIYGKFNSRLDKISPELKEANRIYEGVRNFQKNEGLRRILRPGDNIDTASSALRNYNSTVTKGNTGRNIQELENLLTTEGYKPFLNDIDDVNAAMDLLNARSTGDSWLANLTTNLTRPVLKGVRYANRVGLPERIRNAQEVIREPMQRILNPLVVRTAAPLLYGGISNDEEY